MQYMFTSIQNLKKIQCVHEKALNGSFIHPTHQHILNTLWNDTSDVWLFLSKYKKNIKEILDAKNGGRYEEIRTYISDETLRKYFLQFPSAWADLKKKINTYGIENRGTIHIPKENEMDIFLVLLRLNRENDIGENIEASFYKDVLENHRLLKHATAEPLLLDSSHRDLSFLSKSPDKEKSLFIRKNIEYWIFTNSDTPVSGDTEFKKLYPKMIEYLEKIFWFNYNDFPEKPTLQTISDYIARRLWNSETENEKRKLWMFVKSFTAWWSYEKIETLHKTGIEQMKGLKEKFKKVWITLDTEDTSVNGKSIIPGKMTCELEDGTFFTCTMEYRFKSIQSIRLKMWESPDYNNIDALRDMIGIAIVWPDDTPQNTKVQVVSRCTEIMADKWYLIKNKDLFTRNEMKEIIMNTELSGKRPLKWFQEKRHEKSNPKFRNASVSGFTNLNGPVGIEMQFFDQSKYDFWKMDHYTYDPMKIISAVSRWDWFVTPMQALHAIIREIPEGIRKEVLKHSPQEILSNYLTTSQLIPFVWENGEIYIVPKPHVWKFRASRRQNSVEQIDFSMKKDDTAFPRMDTMRKKLPIFIMNLSLRNAEQATF